MINPVEIVRQIDYYIHHQVLSSLLFEDYENNFHLLQKNYIDKIRGLGLNERLSSEVDLRLEFCEFLVNKKINDKNH